jgi:putative ATPase
MDLISGNHEELSISGKVQAPLALRMRPRSFDDYVGQKHLIGAGKMLRRLIDTDQFRALVFCGPPGTGKTSLARVISLVTQSAFVALNATQHQTADLKREMELAQKKKVQFGKTTVVFLDEIHRFNKAQQDLLLPYIENGDIRFIGATTHNPYFYLISALTSRAHIFKLEPLGVDDLIELQYKTIADTERGLGGKKIKLEEAAALHLATVADGDARKCLSALELGYLSQSQKGVDESVVIDLQVAEESIQQKGVVYDRDGDGHYDTISAFIKSMRASDPDSTVYWLAKMLHAGEDLRFIARRLIIAASEDVGLADSNALRVAVAAQQAVEQIGMPEARIILSHAALYIATAPKSNRSYLAINRALEDVENGVTLPVPMELRDGTYAGAKKLGNGVGYAYSHNAGEDGGYEPTVYFEGEKSYYEPSHYGLESRIAERMEYWKKRREAKLKNESS